MSDAIELELELPDVLELRMVQQPRELPADMGALIAGRPEPGAMLAVNRLSELAADPAAQADAQANIGLGAVDPLAYYILARA